MASLAPLGSAVVVSAAEEERDRVKSSVLRDSDGISHPRQIPW